MPETAVDVMRMGRITALRKPNGRVTGIVTGEIMRRLVAKTCAQLYATAFEQACAPFQYAQSTRAGTECVAHSLKALAEADPLVTVVSIVGIGAFDLVSRRSMMQGLSRVDRGAALLPFAIMMFYGRPSEYVWYNDVGQPFLIQQGEWGSKASL